MSTLKRKKTVSPVMAQIEALAKKVEPPIRQKWRSIVEEGGGLLPEKGAFNPLLHLPEETRSELYDFMDSCDYTDPILRKLADLGVTGVLPLHLEDFFDFESQSHWERRCLRATQRANALMTAVEKHKVPYDLATVQALQQQIFSLIANGQADPATIARMGTLYVKVRGNIRAEENHEWRRERFERELQGQIDLALETLAEEVNKHPETREAFDALRRDLAARVAQAEEEEA